MNYRVYEVLLQSLANLVQNFRVLLFFVSLCFMGVVKVAVFFVLIYCHYLHLGLRCFLVFFMCSSVVKKKRKETLEPKQSLYYPFYCSP